MAMITTNLDEGGTACGMFRQRFGALQGMLMAAVVLQQL
jgi:hypothetical protein